MHQQSWRSLRQHAARLRAQFFTQETLERPNHKLFASRALLSMSTSKPHVRVVVADHVADSIDGKTRYKLQVSTDRCHWELLKRYSEVDALRKALLPKFSSVKSSDRYFPPKKVINDANTAQTRRELFQTWFAAICSDANVLIDAAFMEFFLLNNAWRAITAGDDRYIELLLSARVFVTHVPNDCGLMPLHSICKNGFAACAEVILRAAQPDHRSSLMSKLDDTGMSPLHVACAEGHAQVASLLLQYGASPALNSRTAGTPLHAALRNNRREVIELLVAAMVASGDASLLDTEDKKGRSPLHYAVHFRMRDVVQLLLMSGASVDHSEQQSRVSVAEANKSGHTVLHVAAALNDHAMMQVIGLPWTFHAHDLCSLLNAFLRAHTAFESSITHD